MDQNDPQSPDESLVKRLESHIAALAPHQKRRQAGQLLIECRHVLRVIANFKTGYVTDSDVARVEEDLGIGQAAWDMVEAKSLIAACVRVMMSV